MKQTKTTGENILNSYSIIKSPLDDLMLVVDDSALTGLYFVGSDHIPAPSNRWTLDAQHPVLEQAAKQLQEYFTGKRKSFSVPLRLAGTDFQRKVWREIALIPYGETINYSDLAQRAGAPQAVRAAGTATGRNPVSIIVPCHRVMGKNGDMCGFGGGLERKRYLLELENSDTTLVKKETPPMIHSNANGGPRCRETGVTTQQRRGVSHLFDPRARH
jgi:methylated-DNA-[protein]-cysteine S-methyltransferase